ncbi:MAG: hypothetical protein CL978_01025 [Euryarchaeota archaeon]|jgi:hypothetical protein|nr:hypothetical protein [Euryarchaeota archaeon]MBR96590.1 hypothetical protein [Euryarchaeota archaeon]|tara:strand:- start:10304 stop:10678 length:375 start_codon:yes stop_codon:yes gene_type:complete
MGLFDKFKKRFSKSGDVEEPVENNDSSEDQLYMEKYQNNNQNIADEVMDILMLEEKQEELETPELVISEYDAGDVDLIELENQNLENNSTKNVVVHDSFDDLDDHLKGAKIIGDISKEVSFDSE